MTQKAGKRRKDREGPRVAPPVATWEPISRREWIFVSLWALLLVVVVAAPLWHGYQRTPPGWTFVGFVGNYPNDYHSYTAWMRQAVDGHLLFRVMFTTEPHSRAFLHPLFWVMGTASRLTGASLLAVWYLVQGLGCILMVAAIYTFSSYFTSCRRTRALALVLSTTAAGLGWLVDAAPGAPWTERPIDQWLVVSNQFHAAASSFFTLPIALGLMLLAMVRALRYLEGGRLRDAAVGGLLALALAATHQYDMVMLYGVLAVWTVMAGRRRFGGMLLLAALSIPYCIYSLALVRLDPVISQLTWEMEVPTLSAYVLGWGVPLLLAILAVLVPGVHRHNPRVILLAAWLLTFLAAMQLPIDFRRKLMWGVHVPICVLAAMAAVWLWSRFAGRLSRPRLRLAAGVLAAAALVGFCAVGSVSLYLGLFQRNAEHRFGDYLPDAYVEAMHWLEEHGSPEDAVLAMPAISQMLPGQTGTTVFSGHWAQTVDEQGKAAFLALLFDPQPRLAPATVQQVLARNRVRYIVLDAQSAGWPSMPEALPRFVFSQLTRPVFRNQSVAIWEVRDSHRRSPSEPWPSGDWRGPG